MDGIPVDGRLILMSAAVGAGISLLTMLFVKAAEWAPRYLRWREQTARTADTGVFVGR